MKRPLAYITAPWGVDSRENQEKAADYCRQVYEAGYSPICPLMFTSQFLRDAVPQEHQDGLDIAQDYLRRSRVLVVCGQGPGTVLPAKNQLKGEENHEKSNPAFVRVHGFVVLGHVRHGR